MSKTWKLVLVSQNGNVVEETFPLDDYTEIRLETTEVPDDDTDRTTARFRVKVSGLNVRQEATTSSTDIGDLTSGQELTFYTDQQPAANGYFWRQIAEYADNPSLEGAWCAERSTSNGGVVYLQQIADDPAPDPGPTGKVEFLSGSDQYGEYHYVDFDGDGTARPIGAVNIRSWFHWEALPHTNPGRRPEYLNLLKNVGVQAIRCYLPQKGVDPDQAIARAKTLLDQAQAAGMKLWVVLTDSLGASGFVLKANERWHKHGQYGHLTEDYYKSKHYRVHFMPFAEKFIRECGDHPALLMVEDTNEPSSVYQAGGAASGNPQYYFDFLQEFSAKVKSIAPSLPVAMGCINMRHLWPGADLAKKTLLLNSLPHVDVLTGHMYSEDVTDRFAKWPKEDACHEDMLAARRANHKMAYMVGEYGANGAKIVDWRSNACHHFMERWITERNAQSCAAWAFMFEGHDVGIGDHDYGMDNVLPNNAPYFEHDKQRYTVFNNEAYPLKELPASPKV